MSITFSPYTSTSNIVVFPLYETVKFFSPIFEESRSETVISGFPSISISSSESSSYVTINVPPDRSKLSPIKY